MSNEIGQGNDGRNGLSSEESRWWPGQGIIVCRHECMDGLLCLLAAILRVNRVRLYTTRAGNTYTLRRSDDGETFGIKIRRSFYGCEWQARNNLG